MMKKTLLLVFSLCSLNTALANTCPIAELESQKFKVTGYLCNNAYPSTCILKADDVKSMVIEKGNEWGMTDLYWVKRSRDPQNPSLYSAGFGFSSSQVNRENNKCTKTTNADGSVTYTFYHNYCSNYECSEQFVVTGDRAFYTLGGRDRFIQYSLEKF